MTHEESIRERRGIYRSRHGIAFGVCRGLAESLDFSVFWVRLLAFIFFLVSFGWALVIYIGLALVMKPEPVVKPQTDSEAEFYNSYAHSRRLAVRRLQDTFERLNRRIQRMESIVTARDYNWEHRLER